MADVIDLAAERWERETDPSLFTPREALVALLREIDAGYVTPAHVIVVYSTEEKDDGLPRVGYRQAGSLERCFGTVGLLMQAMGLMRG